MNTQINKGNWVRIAPRTFKNDKGDVVVFIDKNTAVINETIVSGHLLIHSRVQELGRKSPGSN